MIHQKVIELGISRFCEAERYEVVQEFEEVESAKGDTLARRRRLKAALGALSSWWSSPSGHGGAAMGSIGRRQGELTATSPRH